MTSTLTQSSKLAWLLEPTGASLRALGVIYFILKGILY